MGYERSMGMLDQLDLDAVGRLDRADLPVPVDVLTSSLPMDSTAMSAGPHPVPSRAPKSTTALLPGLLRRDGIAEVRLVVVGELG